LSARVDVLKWGLVEAIPTRSIPVHREGRHRNRAAQEISPPYAADPTFRATGDRRTPSPTVRPIRSRLSRNRPSTRTRRLAFTKLPFPPPFTLSGDIEQHAPCKKASQGALSRPTQDENRHAVTGEARTSWRQGSRLRSFSTARHLASLGGGLSAILIVCSTACVTLATLSVERRTRPYLHPCSPPSGADRWRYVWPGGLVREAAGA
jgi:hypothetical protein